MVNRMAKRDLNKILFLICFWVICAIFITLYEASVLGFKSEIDGEHYSFIHALFSVIITCLIGASILGSLWYYHVTIKGNTMSTKPANAANRKRVACPRLRRDGGSIKWQGPVPVMHRPLDFSEKWN